MSTPDQVLDHFREMTGQSIVLSAAIARHAGISPADLEVLGAIEQRGPLAAGELARLTGLSAAAVTGLIDRLERAGVAERRPDPADRRRVLVGVAKGAERIAALYGSLERDARRVLDGRSSEELETISSFLRDMHAVGVEHVARLERS
jgi:DNA-binding MarR family transcriptional regulator